MRDQQPFDVRGVRTRDEGMVYVSSDLGIVTLSTAWEGGVTSVEMDARQAAEVVAELTLAFEHARAFPSNLADRKDGHG